MAKTCKDCKRDLDLLEFAAESRKTCKGCELFLVTKNNERGRGKPLELTREQMLEAFGVAISRRCYYCGISETAYIALQVITPSGKPGLRLGIDRADSAASYKTGNVVVCCLVCNRIKSSLFSHVEMKVLGRTINELWVIRGIDAVLPEDAP